MLAHFDDQYHLLYAIYQLIAKLLLVSQPCLTSEPVQCQNVPHKYFSTG